MRISRRLFIRDGVATVTLGLAAPSFLSAIAQAQGLPNRRGKPGDLFAEAQVMVPGSPTSEERRLFEELAKTSTFDPRSSR